MAVVDNGVGLDAVEYLESRGLGLSNLRARLEAVYGRDAALDLRNEPEGRGTAAVLDLPTKSAHEWSYDQEEPARGKEQESTGSFRTFPAVSPANALAQWTARRPILAALAVWILVAILRIQHSAGYMAFRDRLTPAAIADAVRYDVTVAALWLAQIGRAHVELQSPI